MEYKKDGFINQRAIVLPHFIKELMIQNELTRLLYVTDIGFYPKAKEGTIVYVTRALNRIS